MPRRKAVRAKTTIAINLAAGLAEVEPNSVVLVDADVQFGDIANALELAPAILVGRCRARRQRRGRAQDVCSPITRTTSSSSRHRRRPSWPTTFRWRAAWQPHRTLATMFRYVIVDTTPGLGEHALTALEHATDGVFVTTSRCRAFAPCVRSSSSSVALQLMPAQSTRVLNFVEKNTGLLLKDAEAILGAPVDVEMPRSTAAVLASNAGVPLIHHDVRDTAAKAFVRRAPHRSAGGSDPEAHPQKGEGAMSLSDRLERARGVHRADEETDSIAESRFQGPTACRSIRRRVEWRE